MKNRKLIMGLVASAWVLGGCLVEPLDEEAGEGIGTVTEAMSTDRTLTPSGDYAYPQDDSTSESAAAVARAAGQASVGSQQTTSAPADPNKPQPDPWVDPQQQTTSTTSTTVKR